MHRNRSCSAQREISPRPDFRTVAPEYQGCPCTTLVEASGRRMRFTSSSMSRNDTLLASFIPCNDSTSFIAAARNPCVAWDPSQPATSSPQGTENMSCGVWSLPTVVMMRRSGNPSKFTSPALSGMGSAGAYDVSKTNRELESLTMEERGMRENNFGWFGRRMRQSMGTYRVTLITRQVKLEVWIRSAQVVRRPTYALPLLAKSRIGGEGTER